MKHENRTAAARAWRNGSSKAPPSPGLVSMAISALLELEADAAQTKAATTARCRAALSAIDRGDLAEARAVLQRTISEAGQP
jgi:hypothetical protein